MRTPRQSGQALVEYLLMLLVAVGVFSTISIGFRAPLLGLWSLFTRQIAAPCPGCTPPQEYHRLH